MGILSTEGRNALRRIKKDARWGVEGNGRIVQKRNGERKATGETTHARKGQTRLRQVNFARNIEIHVRHRRYGMASVLPWWWWLVVEVDAAILS